jgi:hypothetical protein
MSPQTFRAESLVRRWADFYTLGLDTERRRDRQEEISSDLWEHRNYATAEGEKPISTSLSILGRWVAGVPADLSWRASYLLGGKNKKEHLAMSNAKVRNWWQWLAALTAVATSYFGVRQFMTDEVEAGVSAGKIGALILLIGAGLVTIIGLALFGRQPRRGAAMVIVGVMPVALVGGLGLGNIVGLISSIANGEGWWWVPIGIASAAATAAGIGAFSAWWNAPRVGEGPRPSALVPGLLLAIGVLAAGLGVGTGMFSVAAAGALVALAGIGIWTRRVRATA